MQERFSFSSPLRKSADFSIRLAVKLDWKAIAAVHYQSLQVNYAEAENTRLTERSLVELERMWANKLDCSTLTIAVLLFGEKVVGFASVGSCDDDDEAAVGKIYSLYLHPSVWGGGIGQLLMAWCRQTLVIHGYSRCKLWVVDINARARKFYEKQGFTYDGSVKEENGLLLYRLGRDLFDDAA